MPKVWYYLTQNQVTRAAGVGNNEVFIHFQNHSSITVHKTDTLIDDNDYSYKLDKGVQAADGLYSSF